MVSSTRATITDSALPLVLTFITRGLCNQAHAQNLAVLSLVRPSFLKRDIVREGFIKIRHHTLKCSK